MTLDGLGSGIDAELASAGTRLPGTRAGDGAYRLTSRRRRGDAHRVIAATLGVLAIVVCVMAVLILAIQPTASRMQNDIASLTERLSATESRAAAADTDERPVTEASERRSTLSGRISTSTAAAVRSSNRGPRSGSTTSGRNRERSSPAARR